MKKGYKKNIEKVTVENTDFRHVLYTGTYCQLVAMSLKPGEEIGSEVHGDGDQFFRFEEGTGKVVVNETEYTAEDGDVVIVPAGAEHNVINTSETADLKLYTIYAPSHHRDGVVRATRDEAMEDAPEFDGTTTE